MGKRVTIECTTEVDADEFIDKISDSVLFEEAIKRIDKLTHQNKIEFISYLFDDVDALKYMLSYNGGLSINQAEELRVFLKNL